MTGDTAISGGGVGHNTEPFGATEGSRSMRSWICIGVVAAAACLAGVTSAAGEQYAVAVGINRYLIPFHAAPAVRRSGRVGGERRAHA